MLFNDKLPFIMNIKPLTTLMLNIVFTIILITSCTSSADSFDPKKPTYKYAYVDLDTEYPEVALVLSSYAMGNDAAGASNDMLKNGVHLFTAVLTPASYKDKKLIEGVYKFESTNSNENFRSVVLSAASKEIETNPHGYIASGSVTITGSGSSCTISYSITTKSGEVYNGIFNGGITKRGERGNIEVPEANLNEVKNDSLALVEFNGLLPTNKKWDLTKPMDSWAGVKLTSSRRVGELQLTEISGTIPASIGKLSKLSSLTVKFAQSSPSNKLPNEVWDLPIDFLYLDRVVIDDYGKLKKLSSLGYLFLSNISFPNGKIPSEVYGIKTLKNLSIYSSNLKEVSQDIKNLTALSTLTFSRCELANLPNELESLPNLTNLKVAFNSATISKIPEVVYRLKSLKELTLNNSRIEGSIPGELGGLANLEKLDLSGNNLTGSIPENLTKLVKLTELDVRYNKLSGVIPQVLLDKLSATSFCTQNGTQFTNLNCN